MSIGVKEIRGLFFRIALFLFAVYILAKITGFYENWVEYTPFLALLFFALSILTYGLKGSPVKKAQSIAYRLGGFLFLIWLYMVLAKIKYFQLFSLTITSPQVFWASVFLFGLGFVLGALER